MRTRFFYCLLLLGAFVLCGCGGGGGSSSGTGGDQPLKGVWTGSIDATRSLSTELNVEGSSVTGFAQLTEADENFTGPVTGTVTNGHVQFTASLEGHDPLTVETDQPLVPGGGALEGTFRFSATDHGTLHLNHDGDHTINMAGDWNGTWGSSKLAERHGNWDGTITQEDHRISGHGHILLGDASSEFTMVGSVVGRSFAAALAVGGERAVLWRGMLGLDGTILRLEAHYLGRMVPTDGLDEGFVRGQRGSTGGGDDHIFIRPAEALLPPGATETFTASRDNITWSQQSEEAQPGEFLNAEGNHVQFHAPIIGGHIVLKATANENAELFGVSHVLVTGLAARVGDHEIRTVRGASAHVVHGEAAFRVCEFGFEGGGLRIQTPEPGEQRRFELTPEVSNVTLTLTERGSFFANGANETGGFVEYTRVSDHRLSGRFEAHLRQRDHLDVTLTISGVFDVPRM